MIMKLPTLIFILLSCGLAVESRIVEDPTCGGTYRGFQYTITSPNYPRNYPSNTECVYRLQAEPTPDKCEQQFHLQFLDFNVRASEGCKADYLQVGRDNFYCGNAVGLRKFSSSNNTLVVRFHSDDKDNTKGFKILVSALPCNLKLSPLNITPFKDNHASSSKARAIESAASYRRGIRGDGGNELEANNSVTRLNLLTNDVNSSIGRPQINVASAVEPSSYPIANNNGFNDNPRITSYLFLPPKETNANVTVHYNLGPHAFIDKSPSESTSEVGLTYPPTDLLPPSPNSISTFFSNEANAMDKKIGVPSRNDADLGVYGTGLDYAELQVGSNDCDKNGQPPRWNPASSERINYEQSSGNLVYDPKFGFVGSGQYPGGGAGYPGASYPNYPTSYPGGIGSGYSPNYSPGGVGYSNYPTSYPGGTGSVYNPNYSQGGAYDPNYPGYDPLYPNNNPAIGGGGGFGGYPGSGIVGRGGECCRVPSSRRFSIVSPGFPGGAPSGGLSCRYTIVKSSPDICRLILNFRFFNFGDESDPFCSLGYVDIDGERICGCKTGQRRQLLFTDYLIKTISIVSSGYSRSRFSGFLIDVTQESCGQQGYPGYNPGYPGYNSGYIRRRSVNESEIVPSPVDPNPHIRSRRDLGYSYPKPSFPFLDKGSQFIPSLPKGQSHERFFGGNCQSRVFFDWALASKEALFKNARCNSGQFGLARHARSQSPSDEKEDIVAESSCEEINEKQGDIKSPLYPDSYPAGVKKCYRFNRAPNFCKVELYVRDFDLESSQACAKDHLSFSSEGEKYCGRSLNDFRTVFDLTQSRSLEIEFASDDDGTGRGFDIGFSQLPCEPTASF